MPDVSVRFIKARYNKERTGVIMYFREIGSDRTCTIIVPAPLLITLRLASEHEKVIGNEYIHGRLVEILEKRFGAEVKKMSIPGSEGTTMITQIHFLGPAGEFIERFTASDAIAIALNADCPVFIEEKMFEEAVAALEKNRMATADDMESAIIAASSPQEKIPES